MDNAEPQTITITWSSDDNCWIARHNEHRYLSGHGDTPLKAHGELTIAIRASDEIKAMSNVKHTVTCLHLKDDTYIFGCLISSDSDIVTIAQLVDKDGKATDDVVIPHQAIVQRYDIPVTWW